MSIPGFTPLREDMTQTESTCSFASEIDSSLTSDPVVT